MKIVDKPGSLLANFSFTLLGSIFYLLAQWLIFLCIAKVMPVKTVGVYSLAVALTSPVVLLTDLQLRAVVATDKNQEYQFGDYLGTRIILSILSMLTITVLVLINQYDFYIIGIVLAIGFYKVIETGSEIYYGLFQRYEKMRYVGISQALRGFFALLVMVIFLRFTGSLFIGSLAVGVCWLLILIFFDMPNGKPWFSGKVGFSQNIFKIIISTIPLGLVSMLISLNSNIPRYFLESSWGSEALGYFAAMVYILAAGNMVVSALGQVVSPKFAECFARRDYQAFNKLLMFCSILAGLGGLFGYFVAAGLGTSILNFLYTSEYSTYSPVLVRTMAAGVFLYSSSIIGFALTATRRFKIQPVLHLVIVTASLLASWLLIPAKGIMGAANAVVATAAIQFVVFAIAIIVLTRKTDRELIGETH